ncbi:MAG: lipopolysaccharide assembly LapA domain-containing protein [Deferribacterales bacterium]
MRAIAGLIKIAVTLVIIVFAILNTGPVEIQYFFGAPMLKMPVFIVVLGAMLLGVILTTLMYYLDRFKLSHTVSVQKKQIKKLEDELERLRNIPFTDMKD